MSRTGEVLETESRPVAAWGWLGVRWSQKGQLTGTKMFQNLIVVMVV